VVLSAEYLAKHRKPSKEGNGSRKGIPPLSLVAFVDCLMTGCGL
jgi:hypothetical protein